MASHKALVWAAALTPALRAGAVRITQPDGEHLPQPIGEWSIVSDGHTCTNSMNEMKRLLFDGDLEACWDQVLDDPECGTQVIHGNGRCWCLNPSRTCDVSTFSSGSSVYEFVEEACPNHNGLQGFRFSHEGSWRTGHRDMGVVDAVEDCARRCDRRLECAGFTFSSVPRRASNCWLHGEIGERFVHDDAPEVAYTKCTTEPPRCDQVSEDRFVLEPDETEIIFVRHGLSLNNVFVDNGDSDTPLWRAFVNFHSSVQIVSGLDPDDKHWKEDSESRFKGGYEVVCHQEQLCGSYEDGAESSLTWEVGGLSRDCLLHPFGEASAFGLRDMLRQILPPGAAVHGFYASPLRRAIQTLFAGLSDVITANPEAPVSLSLWAHERYKSASDHAHEGITTARFLRKYIDHLPNVTDAVRAGAANIERYAEELGAWTTGFAHKHPPSIEVQLATGEDMYLDESMMRTYPRRTILNRLIPGVHSEPDDAFDERMTVLRRWMKLLPPGKRYVLVAHGGISEGLFGRASENLGVVVGRFNTTAVPEAGVDFFNKIELGRDRYDCSALPGWRHHHR